MPEMPEHQPSPILLILMVGFFGAMAVSALLFWLGALVWTGGIRGLMASLGPGATALFVTLHIPAAIVGILLWQWLRRGLSPLRRVLLEAATLYFCLAVVLGIFMNYVMASLLDTLT